MNLMILQTACGSNSEKLREDNCSNKLNGLSLCTNHFYIGF